MSEAEAEILNVPEKEQIRLSLIYIVKMLENIHKDLLDLNHHLDEGVTVITGRDLE